MSTEFNAFSNRMARKSIKGARNATVLARWG